MSSDYVFYIYLEGFDPSRGDKPIAEVVMGEQPMLDKVVALTKVGAKFSVFRVGECVGDYS